MFLGGFRLPKLCGIILPRKQRPKIIAARAWNYGVYIDIRMSDGIDASSTDHRLVGSAATESPYPESRLRAGLTYKNFRSLQLGDGQRLHRWGEFRESLCWHLLSLVRWAG
eukprot:1296292-Amphidinium_carterae.1